MRYTEFLLEYDRSREQNRIEAVGAYQTRQKQDPGFSLEKLESADPTAQKIYVPRLATWWLAGEPTEDLISTTADALAKYHLLKNKKLIRPEHADIGRFRTADQFTDVLSQYTLPGDAVPLDRGKYTEIHRDGQLIVVQLLDKTAAQWWGKSTQWCTAAQNNNQFARYATKGPLYVIVDRVNNTRYQLWWRKTDPEDVQFMDEQDQSATPHKLSFFQKLQTIMHPLHSHIMWNPNPTEAEQLKAVRKNGHAIQWIPTPSEAVQLAAVQQNGDAIQWIKNPSEQAQLAAVQQNGDAIRRIPNPSEEVQLMAVQQDGYAIRRIPNPSEAVQLMAVQRYGDAIRRIPNPSEQVQLAAVQQHGWSIQYIKKPSEQVQLAAVQQDGWSIQLIPNPSEQVQLMAVKQEPRAFFNIEKPTPAVLALYQKLTGAK